MKALLRSVAVLGLLTALAIAPARAQSTINVGVGGGVSIPSGSTSDALKTGWNFNGAVQFKPATSPVGFQIDGMYSQLKAEDAARLAGLDKDQVIDGTGNIVYWFPVSGETRFRPYVLAGGGVYNLKRKLTDGTSSSETKFGINGGAGFDYNFQRNVGVFVEGRFHDVIIKDAPDFHFIPINAGIRFATR
jgi:opacity protein-like surface antigen